MKVSRTVWSRGKGRDNIKVLPIAIAYNLPDDRSEKNIVYFTTAWSAPKTLMFKLSKIFPLIVFIFSWADEDLGHNVGIIKIQNGELLEENIPDGGSLEAKKMFFDITLDSLEDHCMDENFNYIEEDD